MKVYGGIDQLSGEKLWLRETVPAPATRRESEREAEKVRTRLLNQVDERRSPRTEAAVNDLLDRWLEVVDIDRKTRAGYVSKIEKRVRPTIGRVAIGRVRADTLEGLYADLRRCRDHCGRRTFVQHRTDGEHVCDEHSARRQRAKTAGGDEAHCKWCKRACATHRCRPLAAGSILVVHAILSGAFARAVRLGWVAVSPIDHRAARGRPRRNLWPGVIISASDRARAGRGARSVVQHTPLCAPAAWAQLAPQSRPAPGGRP